MLWYNSVLIPSHLLLLQLLKTTNFSFQGINEVLTYLQCSTFLLFLSLPYEVLSLYCCSNL